MTEPVQEIIPPTTSQGRGTSERSLANLRPFQRGTSGNPGGKPKGEDVRALARKNTKRAMERIVELIEDADPRVALMAAKEVLDRAYGKPKVAEDSDDDPNSRKNVTINIVRYADRDQPTEPVATETVSVRTLALS